MLYLFQDFALDSNRREIRRGGRLLPIEPQVFDLLLFLIENRDRVVSKDDLLASVWGGRIVSASTLDSRINAARRVIADSGREQRLIRTTIGKGIRFVGALQEQPAQATAQIAPPVPTPAILSLPEKPAIAVLPFQNMSGDPDQDYFVDGMVEEIVTALSRIRWLYVVARASSFSYKGQVVDVKQVGRELGVRYVLEGSVRKSGEQVRIAGQLIDTETGTHLWADRFEGALDSIFDLQDKVASSLAGVIEPTLQAAEIARSASRSTNDLTAYDLYLRAYAMFHASAKLVPEALRLVEAAIVRDPQYGPALAWAALCVYRLLINDRREDQEVNRRKGADFARRALEVVRDDPVVLANAAIALAYFGENIDAMMVLIDRALAFNPNFARGWFISGVLRNWAGWPDTAIEHLEVSMHLSPRVRVGPSLFQLGAAHLYRRRFDEAVPKLLVAIQEDPSDPHAHRYLAASYAHMGRLDDARAVVERLRASALVVIPDVSFLRDADYRGLYLSGLRVAAGEAYNLS